MPTITDLKGPAGSLEAVLDLPALRTATGAPRAAVVFAHPHPQYGGTMHTKAVYQGIRAAGIRFLTALPETWLVYLLQLAEDDPEMTLVEVAKEEEAIGIGAGAYFAGAKNALLMQNHGFLASINGIVSLAMLYRIPLVMLVAHRGHFGEPYPWHTQGGIVTEPVLRALGLPFEHARDPARVGQQIQDAQALAWSSLGPVALLLSRDLMED